MAKRVKVKGKTKPSSTIKKIVKPGNPKFIGPRELEEFNPWNEFESSGDYHPRNRHTYSRGVRKAQKRAEMRQSEDARRAYKNEKVSQNRADRLKAMISSEANSREGRLLNTLLQILKDREDDGIPF
jgi:hypothetical protein